MALQSMTGFARTEGLLPHGTWRWELRSVNGKGLDMRFRLPPGYDHLEASLKGMLAGQIIRGNVSANLFIDRKADLPDVRVNEAVLTRLAEIGGALARKRDLQPPTLDGLLAVRGVVEVVEADQTEAERAKTSDAVAAGFEDALSALIDMREAEGRSLQAILLSRLDDIAALRDEAEHNPARQPDAIKARIKESIRVLLEQSGSFDPVRLHQEALLVAAKVDIREELDRLTAHVAAARALLNEKSAVGRKLDFLAQEFNREVNTLCSKSNDVSLTATGLALKAVVEQFREQVQNLE